jgi:hypothetical protein
LAAALLLLPLAVGLYRFGETVIVPGVLPPTFFPLTTGVFVFVSLALQMVVFREFRHVAAAASEGAAGHAPAPQGYDGDAPASDTLAVRRLPPVRAVALRGLRRVGVVIATLLALALMAWTPAMLEVGLWRVLLAVEIAGVFLLLAAGITTVVMRLALDLAGKLSPQSFSTARLAVRLAGLVAAGAYAWAFWQYGRRDEREILISTLLLALAMIGLGLNRLGAMDGERLRRFR